MRCKSFLLIPALLCQLFALFAYGAAPANQQPDASIPHRGTLYRVSNKENTVYLFGTIHIGQPSFFPLDAETTQDFNQASTLMVEVNVLDNSKVMAAMQKYAMYGAEDNLAKHISAKSLSRLRQTGDKLGIPYESVQQMKPWMAANLLELLALEKQGYQAALGADLFLLNAASKQNKKVEELETVDYQLSLFESMTAKQQEQFLNETLSDIDNGEERKQAQELITAWGHADSKTFANLLREERNSKNLSDTFIQRILLDQRNPVMVEQIEKHLLAEKTSFAAVGLLHLIGDNGIPELLRRRGYQVEKLY